MQPMEKIKYYDDDMEKGIVIDYAKLERNFKKLKVPTHVWQGLIPWNDSKIFVIMSRRGTGKSTTLLLKGMLLYAMYGIRLEWIRQEYDMIKKTNTEEMFNTIRQFGYIYTITKGKYNDVIYKNRSYYFCLYDGKKTPSEVDESPFMRLHSIDDEKNIRSSYNSPFGDLIVLDEYQSPSPKLKTEFSSFFNIVSTIRRKRKSTRLVFLGNTTSPYNHYYHELDITKIILKMKPNDKALYTTKRGAKVYIEWVDPQHTDKRRNEEERILDNEYFGFEGLNSIIGDGWDISNYPHITRELDKEKEVVSISYLHTQIFDLEMKLCYHENIGYFVFVRPVNYYNIDSNRIMFTDAEIDHPNKIKGIGKYNKYCRKLWQLMDEDRFLYTTNDIGELVTDYYRKYKML